MAQEPEYEVLFYETRDGFSPTDDFLDSLGAKVRGKLEKWIEQLEIHGPNLPRPFADTVRDKIRELRLRWGSNHFRFLYFFVGKKIVITHGFLKKTAQVPEAEINRAIRYMNDFLIRLGKGDIQL